MHAQIMNLVTGFSNQMKRPVLVVIKLIKTNLLTLKIKNIVSLKFFHGTFRVV